MEENKYQEAYYELKSSLKGEKYLDQEVAKLDLGDTMLIKSQTEDGKLCWIVENKKENIKPDYIEAFENIICQKRDNGYISDAYRNDISVVYEALNKLEKLKIEGEEIMQENKNKEYIQKDIELTNKLVEGEKNNMNRLTKKIETINNGGLAIDNYEVVDNGHIKNDTAFAINKLGRIEDLEEELGCPIEDAFETTEVYEERCKNLEKEQEDTRKNVIEYFKKKKVKWIVYQC